MVIRSGKSRQPGRNRPEVLARIASLAEKSADERMRGYREQSLRIHPWVCARCGREFNRENLTELTVHHKDHNHDNNPNDGSNWENLCLYCHDNEHSRYVDHLAAGGIIVGEQTVSGNQSTYNPFSELKKLLEKG